MHGKHGNSEQKNLSVKSVFSVVPNQSTNLFISI